MTVDGLRPDVIGALSNRLHLSTYRIMAYGRQIRHKSYNLCAHKHLGIAPRNNGEGGIRTRGTLKRHTGFRNQLDKPLRHLSNCL